MKRGWLRVVKKTIYPKRRKKPKRGKPLGALRAYSFNLLLVLLFFGSYITSGRSQIPEESAKLKEIQAAFFKEYKETVKPALEKSHPLITLMDELPPEGFKDWYDALYLRPINKNTIRIRNGKNLRLGISSLQERRGRKVVKFGLIENLKDHEEYYCIYLGGAGFLVNVMSTTTMQIILVYTEPEG